MYRLISTNLVLSHPGLTQKQRVKCVNTLADVLTRRKITRDRSVLEIAATVTGSVFSPRSSRVARRVRLFCFSWDTGLTPYLAACRTGYSPRASRWTPHPGRFSAAKVRHCVVLQDVFADFYSAQPFLELPNSGSGEVTDEPRVPGTLSAEKQRSSQQPPAPQIITRHGTEVFGGLITPGNSPIKTPGNRVRFRIPRSAHLAHLSILSQPISTVIEQDFEMDGTLTSGRDNPPTPPPGPDFGSPTPQGTQLRSDPMSAPSTEIDILRQEKEYILRVLSRNGQGTLSDIKTVADRAVRQRDELHAENEELRTVIELLKSGLTDLQNKIAHTQEKLSRAEGERIQMVQSRRRWIARMWALAGRVPGELRKKDSEIENMREKLAGMYARLAQEQSQLREFQGQLEGERARRVGVETELHDSRTAHAQQIKDRDMAGRKLRDQLNQVINCLDSGTISI